MSHAQRTIPYATTPLEQVAELGEFLAAYGLAHGTEETACWDFMTGTKVSPAKQRLCDRERERMALWRKEHAQLRAELKIQDGLYGCPTH